MRRLVPATLAAALLLTACGPDAVTPGPAEIDVDTPQLRQLKSQTEVEQCAAGPGVAGGLPDLTLPCLGGGPAVDLASLRGPMIVNLWAANCGPCRKEMPALQDFYETHGDRVPVLGIDYQDVQPAAALDLARRSGVTYPLLADPGGDLNGRDPLPVVRGLPYLVFVSADGEVTARAGGIDSSDELVELANQHLGTDL